jgi:transcriptional regulator with PAS, ATPase and Fis domain
MSEGLETLLGRVEAEGIADRDDEIEDLATQVAHPDSGFSNLLGRAPAFLDALRVARQASAVDASVLITGQSGTGKERFARAIHEQGARASEPFVGLACAALPVDRLETELFGFDANPGKLELAGRGTILLDEVGDLPLGVQAKLDRVLQERMVVRFGGSCGHPVHARVIATTHRDLDRLVTTGAFRLDLLGKVRDIGLYLPPLSVRAGDIALLARAFLGRYAQEQRKAVRELSDDVLRALRAHSWPGNVRELANVIEREVSFLPHAAAVLSKLQLPLAAGVDRSDDSQPPVSGPVLRLVEVERRAFLEALRACGGNVPRASKALGVSKVTFYARLRDWGMHPRSKVAG